MGGCSKPQSMSVSATPSPSMTQTHHHGHGAMKRQTKTPPARPQKMRTKPPMSIHRKCGLIHPTMTSMTMTQQSKSEKLRSKSEESVVAVPPKMALNEKKSVNFDAFVDIVGDEKEKKKREKMRIKPMMKPRSKSQTNEKKKKKKEETQEKGSNRSHRAVAKILLDELMSSSEQKRNGMNKYEGFRLSDLLKDGMLSSDELEQADYGNYYYFLQSDKQIYQ